MGEASEGKFYAVRTTSGQELNVALLLENRAKARKIPLKSIIVIDRVKGFIFIEAITPLIIDRIIMGLKYVKGRVGGTLSYSDLEYFIVPKSIIESIDVNDIVEIVSGPFRGMKGRVIYVDKAKGEIKVEILEASYPLPITINADYVRIVEKSKSK